MQHLHSVLQPVLQSVAAACVGSAWEVFNYEFTWKRKKKLIKAGLRVRV